MWLGLTVDVPAKDKMKVNCRFEQFPWDLEKLFFSDYCVTIFYNTDFVQLFMTYTFTLQKTRGR